jgi:hypothetical protein
MFRRVPAFVLWMLLAFSAVVVPVACVPSAEEETSDAGRPDGMAPPASTTGS